MTINAGGDMTMITAGLEERILGPADGPPLVFLHGPLVDSTLWSAVGSELAARGFRCYLPTLPLGAHRVPFNDGTDLTPNGVSGLVLDYLAAHDLKQVTLVSNDSGGAIAQLLLTRDTSRLRRAIITNCDTFDNFSPFPYNWLFAAMALPGVGLFMMSFTRMRWFRRMFTSSLTKRADDALTAAWVRGYLTDAGVRADFAAFAKGMPKTDLTRNSLQLRDVRVPVDVVWASDDGYFKLADGRRLAGCFTDSTFTTIDDSLAFVPIDQPGRLADLIEESLHPADSAR